ncbi:hypothetical protein GWI33_022776 [Rhynchophorus ferrugineus]|uniref:Bromo domain-containing protein n=1 Tax=Rhynchophorus ferrugineus TaxID=354439 RepID=A0A834MIU6_RHYFE|nr:hypothetical protein GWI33_022776 [Rhynchophorus ferrugineus]
MVNTRRMESIGSPTTRPHRTRGASKLEEQDTGSSSEKEEEGEESDSEKSEDDTSSDSPSVKPQRQLRKKGSSKVSTKVVSIRRNFKRNFQDHSVGSSHKTISLQRSSLAVYAKRKMTDEMEISNTNFSDDEFYSNSRSHRSNRLMKKNRMLRRTALSLRPISQKCYADHSPIHFDSDSDVLKRSTRKRNMSWLADSQMHKVGYPNLNIGYSEEDSRDAVDDHENVEIPQRVTRYSNRRRIVKPSYYYEEYEEGSDIRKSNRTIKRERRTRLSESNKTTKEDVNSTKTVDNDKIIKEEPHEETTGEDNDTKSSKENDDVKSVQEDKNKDMTKQNNSEKKDESSDSDVDQRTRTLKRRVGRPSRVRIREEMDGRKKVIDTSSETEEEGRTYSLRNRAPKPTPKTMQTSVLRNERREMRSRKRYTRRRRDSSSSDSSSSTSDRCRKPSKTPKSPHSKNEKMRSGAGGSAILPIKPETLDRSVTFNSIGGLDAHIQCLKEMILLPMMYPEVFHKFQIQPPRGVLFHGPPGTGKTLISRALANECSFGTQKVSFFLRKGADLLSKWIGESERQLRLLFEQAAEMKPSIIFFDELDGLAPVRSSRQDQVHASIVSTLLALMDGLSDRGKVIVIGATNRIDAIDPALRRPGRFDRELYFPLPSKSEREEILKVHISSWNKPPSTDLLGYLAENTVGYCGSDLRALCSEAVIQSFRRTYPQVYNSEHKLLLDPENVMVEKVDFLRAKSMITPASHRVVSGLGKKLIPILQPILGSVIKDVLGVLETSFPHGFNPLLAKVKLSASIRPAQLLITGDGAEHGQTNHVAPAILFKMEHIHSYMLDLTTLFREPGRTAEDACIQVFNEAKRNLPSIIYIPSIDHWWDLVSETVRAILLSQLASVDPNIPLLFLTTSDIVYDNLPEQLKGVFSQYRNEVFEIKPPVTEARRLFFKPLIIDSSLQPPRATRERPNTPPQLPRAPTPPPPPLSEEDARKLYETEEHTLRELRIFLRDMCKKLANNKLFFMFTKPVDTKEVPDYTEIIKQPMDLETMMTKVDFHLYECAKDFLTDIDLICQNALEYNPAKSSADKQIRHRACSLRDYAYTLIKTEMDSDFEDKCQDIKVKRKKRNACTSKYLPPYIITPDLDIEQDQKEEPSESVMDEDPPKINGKVMERNRISPNRKRKFNWQHGYVKKKKKPKLDSTQGSLNKSKEKNSSDESKENDPDSSTVEVHNKSKLTESDNSRNSDVTTALTINCDTAKIDLPCNSARSPTRRLSLLMSPSELLDSPLYFDDVDQALNENASNKTLMKVECSEAELEKVLDNTIKFTDGFPLSDLLDLYNQFSNIIKRFSKNGARQNLPKELTKELLRFKKAKSVVAASHSNSS